MNLDLKSIFQAATPTSITTTGILDTASNGTGVSTAILQQLGAPRHSTASTTGIGGTASVGLYVVSLFIFDAKQPNIPWIVRPNLMVFELPTSIDENVLIGMDVLQTCKLFVDGPAGLFTLGE